MMPMNRAMAALLFATSLLAVAVIMPSPIVSATPTYDYLVAGSLVKDPGGSTVYTGSNMSDALNWALSDDNTVTYVPAGTYDITQRVTGFADGVTLIGDGIHNTTFNFTWSPSNTSRTVAEFSDNWFFGFCPTDVSGVTLKDFTIIGDGCIYFNTSTVDTYSNLVYGVSVENTSSTQITSIGSWVSAGHTSYGFTVYDCYTYNTGGDGFDIWGRGGYTSGGMHRSVTFYHCEAYYAGYTERYWDWCVGFDIGENGRVDYVNFSYCKANYNWENGFHFEAQGTYPSYSVMHAKLSYCTANYNGQKYSDPRGAAYGRGCHAGMYPTLISFTGTGNPGGNTGWTALYEYWNDFYNYKVGSYMGAMSKVYNLAGATVYTGSNFTDALQWAVSQTDSVVKVAKCNTTGLYTVTPFLATMNITLAHGVSVYGNNIEGIWPNAFTKINFTNAGQGFIYDSSNHLINLIVDFVLNNYTNPPQPIVIFPFTSNVASGYSPLSVTFTSNVTSGGNVYSYLWNFDDGATSTVKNPSHVFVNGTFHVTLKVNGTFAPNSITITSSPPTIGSISANRTAGSRPCSVSFSVTVTGLGGYAYQWSFGGGVYSLAQNPTYTFTAAGTYTVSLKVDGRPAPNTLTIVVSNPVAPPPPPPPPPPVNGTNTTGTIDMSGIAAIMPVAVVVGILGLLVSIARRD
jgi:PKD repeat protein